MSACVVAVTGATGFLGRHVIAALQAAGHKPIAVVRRRCERLAAQGVEQRLADVEQPEALKQALQGADKLVHAAGFVSREQKDADKLYRVHVQGTKNVLSAAKSVGIVRAVVLSSSGTVAVSEQSDFVAKEDSTTPIGLIQRWPYYRAKLFAEQAALAENSPSFAVIALCPTLLLGPGDEHGSSTEDVRLFLQRRIPFVPPGGLSFVDVRDVADVVVSALDRGRAGQRYLLGACNLTLREFFGRLERVSGISAPRLSLPRAPELSRAGLKWLQNALDKLGARAPVDPVSADMAQHFWYLDASLAEQELGFAPRDPGETLHDTVRDLRARCVVWPEDT